MLPVTPIPDDVDDAALARYLAGESGQAERAAVERWVAGGPSRAADLDRMRGVWEGAGAPVPSPDLERMWARVQVASQPVAATGMRWAVWKRPARNAAMGTLVAGAVALLILQLRASHQFDVGWRAYTTTSGQREKIALADGSDVTLGPASELHVPLDYAAGDRSVTVDGEAYFAVVHDPVHPFVVRAGSAVVTDIGTRFDVRAYATDGASRVVVAEGEVDVGGVHARAGELAIVDRGRVSVVRGVDVDPLVAWTRGELVFHDTPLREVATQLDRWYGLHVMIADAAMAERPVTGSFTTEPVDEVLRFIAHPIGASVSRSGRTVTFAADRTAP
jgi:transmembrane sensor